MRCFNCSSSLYAQAMDEGTCEICGTRIFSGHIPAESICKSCSEKFDLCEQCGEPLRQHDHK